MVSLILFAVLQVPTGLPSLAAKDVVGKYILSTGYTFQSLNLKKDKSFDCTFSDDVIIPGEESPERRQGKWSLKDDLVSVTYEKRKGWPKVMQYIPVRWDGVFFLIPPGDKKGFIKHVADWRDPIKNGAKDSGTFGHVSYLHAGVAAHAMGPIEVPKRYLKDFAGIK